MAVTKSTCYGPSNFAVDQHAWRLLAAHHMVACNHQTSVFYFCTFGVCFKCELFVVFCMRFLVLFCHFTMAVAFHVCLWLAVVFRAFVLRQWCSFTWSKLLFIANFWLVSFKTRDPSREWTEKARQCATITKWIQNKQLMLPEASCLVWNPHKPTHALVRGAHASAAVLLVQSTRRIFVALFTSSAGRQGISWESQFEATQLTFYESVCSSSKNVSKKWKKCLLACSGAKAYWLHNDKE